MPHPNVTALSQAPSRVSDSANFVVEMASILAGYSNWRTQSNAFATYLNALPFNKYEWGSIAVANPTRVQFSLLPARPAAADSGLFRTQESDTLLFALQANSANQNALGTFLDALATMSGAATFVADASRPVISTISVNPAVNNSSADYETNSITFYEASALYSQRAGELSDYYYTLLNAPEDWGLTTEAVTESDDFGLITEASDG